MNGYVVIGFSAILMLVFGRWGQTHADSLAAGEPQPERRSRKERSLRRGSIAWQVVGMLVLAFAIVGLASR